MGVRQDQLSGIGAEWDAEHAASMQEIAGLHDQVAALQDQLAQQNPTPDPTPDPTPTPTKSMLVGSSLYRLNGETSQEGFDRRTQEWGAAPEIVRYFFSGMPTGWPQFSTAPTVVSFKPPSYDMAGFGSGKYDSYITSWLNALPRDKKPRRVAIWHEREDDIEDGHFTKAQAISADKKLRSLIDSANSRNGTNVKLGIVLMGWTLQAGSHRDAESYIGVDYDWMGWDAYPANNFEVDPDLSDTKYLYGRAAEFSRTHNAESWYVCETGTSNKGHTLADYDTLQAKWLTGAVGVARDLGFKGWCYWDSITGTGQQNNYQIQGPKARAAMGAAIKAA